MDVGRTLRRSWQVGMDRRVVAESRHRVARQAADLPTELAQDVELLTSELVANALVHGAAPVTVGVQRTDHCVRVEVSDASNRLPALGGPATEMLAESRRGFLLIDRLATRWGFERRRDEGKTIWFEVEG